MAHEFHGEDVKTSYSKIQQMLGHKEKHFMHPTEKALDLAGDAYRQNEHLDPLTLPTKDKVGP